MPSRSIRRPPSWDNLGADLEAYFDEFMTPARAIGFAPTPKWRPPTDVWENEDAFHVVMELSGMHAAEIGIEMAGDTLIVSGVRPDEAGGRRNYHVMEIQVGPFERRIRIACPIAVATIEAGYDRGCLRIRLPKAAARPSGPRQIPIR